MIPWYPDPSPWVILLRSVSIALGFYAVWCLLAYAPTIIWRQSHSTMIPSEIPLPQEAVRTIGDDVRARLGWEPHEIRHDVRNIAALGNHEFVAYACLRASGQRVASAWGDRGRWRATLGEALDRAIREVSPRKAGAIDAVEINLAYNFELIATQQRGPAFSNIHRGVKGIEIAGSDGVKRWAPTTMLARNLSFRRILEDVDQTGGPSRVTVSRFAAFQILVRNDPRRTAVEMFRGNQIVEIADVDEAHCRVLADGLATWMENQLQADGRMVYKYWPSRGKESQSDNAIRQFLATRCLFELAEEHKDADALIRAQRNLDYNLTKFYVASNGMGYIAHEQKWKLGAAALAALAIVRSPVSDSYQEQEQGLRKAIDAALQEDGSFHTFLNDPSRDDNQNFYPGEVLLLWASLYEQERDAGLLAKFHKAFEHYYDWHRQNRNPAFVPWHTMAYYRVWRITKNTALAEAILDMNDWLVREMQEWDGATYPDVRGRYYSRKNPNYGPPHASSTGVYLEGLADAFSLARELGDAEREQSYRLAILRGLRSAMQLQFADETDMYYVSQRDRVRGGLRTTVYNNEIRVDNVEHMLMAVLELLRVFKPDDYVRASEHSEASDDPQS